MSRPGRSASDADLTATVRVRIDPNDPLAPHSDNPPAGTDPGVAPVGFHESTPTAVQLCLLPPADEQSSDPPHVVPLTQRACATPFPDVGTRLLHFDLVEELGRGAFARVYLARQESLANRLVVLKVTTDHTDEPQNLARLRHTNIVPIYSVHEADRFQVLCMPFLGRVTLSRAIFTMIATAGVLPASGRGLLRYLGGESLGDHELTRMSYPDGCLWLTGQLAAGLEHAHSHGLLHRDVKPGNVLFTQDGVPMLLDFNVSASSGELKPGTPVGGTIQYMAPEHLRVFIGGGGVVDHRADLFSLGVVLYELLTGDHPFSLTLLPDRTETVRRLIAGRETPPGAIRLRNPAVTPAIESVVAKLLDPRPEGRYQSAAALREDIARHLSHRPLAFARDRSVGERLGKWRRRNPRLATGALVAAVALFLFVFPVAVVANHEARMAERADQARRAECAATADDAIRRLHDASVKLGALVDYPTRAEGLDTVRRLVAEYGVGEADWETRPEFARLDTGRRTDLTAAFAESLVLMTRAEAAAGGYSAPAMAAALRWNALAVGLFPADARPAILDRHRAELEARLAGRPAPPSPPATGRDPDLYHDGLDLAAAGRHREALPLLVSYCDRHPSHHRASFARGVCETGLGLPADAVASFSACLALRPDCPDALLSRGIARHDQGRYRAAEADYTRALDIRPDWTLALMNRGLARYKRGDFRGAAADYTAALADPGVPTRVYFLRASARAADRDAAGAAADRGEGVKREPNDPRSWAVRGHWRMAAEPRKAIADFDAALEIDPLLHHALINKAIVLADHLHQEADAIPVLDRLLELYPDNVDARASRGVYLARLGKADAARRDAADSLKADGSAYRKFQIAGLHAQLSKNDPAARGEALRFLALALRAGYDDARLIAGDADLDPIRGDAEFERLVKAAAAVAMPAGKK